MGKTIVLQQVHYTTLLKLQFFFFLNVTGENTPEHVTKASFMISEVSHSLVPDVIVSRQHMDLDQIRWKYEW